MASGEGFFQWPGRTTAGGLPRGKVWLLVFSIGPPKGLATSNGVLEEAKGVVAGGVEMPGLLALLPPVGVEEGIGPPSHHPSIIPAARNSWNPMSPTSPSWSPPLLSSSWPLCTGTLDASEPKLPAKCKVARRPLIVVVGKI